MPLSQKEAGHSSNVFTVILLCSCYMLIGPTLILLNKYILYELKFPYPMFLSALGVLVSGLAAQLIVRLGYVKLQRRETVEGIYWYQRILPVGLAYAGTLALGNTAYLLLDVGFIQMLKSFVPVIIMITSYVCGIEYPTRPVIISVIIISLGTAGTCSYTPNLSIVGLLVMFCAELFEAIRLVLTQNLLQNLKFGVVEGQYVLSPASSFWLMLASCFFEFRKMYDNNAIDIILANPLTFVAASTLGLCVNFLTYYVIQVTSSLTTKILGGVRSTFTIAVGVIRYGEVVDVREAIGYSIAFAGFLLYSAAKVGYWDSAPKITIWDSGKGKNMSSSTTDYSSTSSTNGLLATVASSSFDKMEAQNLLSEVGVTVIESSQIVIKEHMHST